MLLLIQNKIVLMMFNIYHGWMIILSRQGFEIGFYEWARCLDCKSALAVKLMKCDQRW